MENINRHGTQMQNMKQNLWEGTLFDKNCLHENLLQQIFQSTKISPTHLFLLLFKWRNKRKNMMAQILQK